MAQHVSITMVDDLDGTEATETITFALDGAAHEIDLSKGNADKLRAAFGPYVEAARKVKGAPRKGAPEVRNREQSKTVREWAASAGVPVKDRGRIPEPVIEKWRAAGSPAGPFTAASSPAASSRPPVAATPASTTPKGAVKGATGKA